jgi:hypothetical protein
MNLPIERSRMLSCIRNDIELSESENDPSIRSDEPTPEVPGGSCGETIPMEEMLSGNADVLLVIATEIVDPSVDAPPTLKEAPVNDPVRRMSLLMNMPARSRGARCRGDCDDSEPHTAQRSTLAFRSYPVEVDVLFFPRPTTSRPRTSCYIDSELFARVKDFIGQSFSLLPTHPLAQGLTKLANRGEILDMILGI